MRSLNHIIRGFVITFVLDAWLATAAQGANGFTFTGSLDNARDNHTATLLPSGNVLVVAGNGPGGNCGDLSSAELYHPSDIAAAPSCIGNLQQHIHVARLARLAPAGQLAFPGK